MGSKAAPSTKVQDAAFAKAFREAYDQGYDDGVENATRRPPKHILSASSGLGVISLLKCGMVAFTVCNMGKTLGGWDPQLAIVNAKANPMQAAMMLVLLSVYLF